MEEAKVKKLAIFMAFLVLIPNMESQLIPRVPPTPRLLCISQFALVNNACSLLPFSPRPPSPPNDDVGIKDDDHNRDHDHDHDHDNDNDRNHDSNRDHDHNHDRDHGQRHGHGHRRGHRRRHRHHETPVEEDCCHWLAQVDDECVCDLLVRLPPFLSKPRHDYTVVVDESCNVTFSCGGRIRP